MAAKLSHHANLVLIYHTDHNARLVYLTYIIAPSYLSHLLSLEIVYGR